MGCEIPIGKGAICPDTRQIWTDGQIVRGRFLDAFARLETAVMAYVVRLEIKVTPSAPFSQKLKRLGVERERFNHPKKLDDRLSAIVLLNELRADLVHASLTVLVQYDENRSIRHWLGFQNACRADKPLRLISLEEMENLTRRTAKLAREFSQQRLKEAAPAAPASAT